MTAGPYVLIVVDMMVSFFGQAALSLERGGLVRRINDLAGAVRGAGGTVMWVRQEFAPDLSDAPLEMRRLDRRVNIAGTPECQLLPELEVQPADRVVIRKRYSAFFGTGLESALTTLQPGALIVAGVNTHAAVLATVIDAYQRDYEVIVPADCVRSIDPLHHRITLQYLDNTLARVTDSGAILTALRLGLPL